MVTCTLPGCQGSWDGQDPGPRQRRDTRTWTAGPGRPSAETSSQLLIKRYFLIQSRECFRVCFCKFKDTCHNDWIFKNKIDITFFTIYEFYSMKHPASCNFSQAACVHLISKNGLKFWTVFILSLLFRHLFYDQAHVQNPSTKAKYLTLYCSGPDLFCSFVGKHLNSLFSPYSFILYSLFSHNYQM